ncbi:Tyrosine-protein phosphatase YwqE [Pseudobythopirellula maris]|uniref:protein-tyrosine-phosphatase n=1 Tax=Pseudobythopirellula maris TaxID=2527991 RepID=A0A5C5ZKA9_9BACT|nr:CpsB/CapC family capsule biosynthesis tyrosine phosphatase [Pseudobythopirellula maris]TWT87568.1 Tyrosine-protein phosphatase YwqE [Pseudobythopirellula maris]
MSADTQLTGFVDIHSHLTPGIDDGAADVEDSLAMAQLAVDEGIKTIICTPHQLGGYAENKGDDIRRRVAALQETLDTNRIPLQVLPGADVRIEDGMIDKLASGEVVSLGDHRKHVLLELPHELYFPLEPVLDSLERLGMTGVLSHPERNRGLLHQPAIIEELVERGCLMQVTAASLIGGFGQASQAMAERMVKRGMVHFLATDAHSPKSRRPMMRGAFARATELAGEGAAVLWCREFPLAVAEGRPVPAGPTKVQPPKRSSWMAWGRSA